MQDTELYQQILGLKAPWNVSRIALKVKEKRVDLWVAYEEGARFACPECGKRSPVRDHREREWRHLDSCQACDLPALRRASGGVRQSWSETGGSAVGRARIAGALRSLSGWQSTCSGNAR